MIKVGVAGASGKMGSSVLRLIKDNKEFVLNGLLVYDVESQKSLTAAHPSMSDRIYCEQEVEKFVQQIDLVIDFSSYAISPKLAALCSLYDVAMVCGTTGMSNENIQTLKECANITKIFYSPNMSLGINVMASLVRSAVSTLGKDYDIEIIEHHHRDKKDSPSGTALMLANSIVESVTDYYEVVVGREMSKIAVARQHNQIYIHSIRAGSAVGDHTVVISGLYDTITLQHRANNRDIFAYGAIEAAKFLLKQPPSKLYTMSDFLSSS